VEPRPEVALARGPGRAEAPKSTDEGEHDCGSTPGTALAAAACAFLPWSLRPFDWQGSNSTKNSSARAVRSAQLLGSD
jgi:hypothetical protein